MSSVRGGRGGRRVGRANEPVRASTRFSNVDVTALPTAPPTTSPTAPPTAPSTDPSSTSGLPLALLENPTGTTDEAEIPPVTKRRVRGPTRASAETNRDRDAARIRVTFSEGAPVSDKRNTFKTTVLGWIHSPLILPQNVQKYDDIPFLVKETLFKRINDLFEIVVVHPPTRSHGEAGSSSQTVDDPTTNPTSSATAHPTSTHASSTASTPDLPGRILDPASCLPLSVADRYVVEGWVRDRFRSHRNEICMKHYDAYETDEERLAHPPENWPEDMWRWVVAYWGTDEFKKKRALGKANKAKATLKHTTGSEMYKNKRYKIMLETGEEVDERQFFIKTHTKKDGSFVDDASRIIAEKIEERTAELTLESGVFIGTSGGVLQDAVGAPTKGRGLFKGRVPPKPKTKGISAEEMQRVLEYQRRALVQSHQDSIQEMERRLTQDIERRLTQDMERRMNERMTSQFDEFMARFQQQQQQSQQVPPPPP